MMILYSVLERRTPNQRKEYKFGVEIGQQEKADFEDFGVKTSQLPQ